jgi:hypothetical protein
LGLDRVPEVRTLRQKLQLLCADSSKQTAAEARLQQWSAKLAGEWLEANAQSAGQFYVDGHVRVYHGAQTALPRRYVAREKLCLRGTTDYWVNALDGQPFFLVTRPVDPGMLTVIREQIVPQLEALVPPRCAGAEPPNPRPRFTLVFDREGYSPEFFGEMKEKGIAVLTYHKFPGDDWPLTEFRPHTVTLANGEQSVMALAERRVELSGKCVNAPRTATKPRS